MAQNIRCRIMKNDFEKIHQQFKISPFEVVQDATDDSFRWGKKPQHFGDFDIFGITKLLKVTNQFFSNLNL